MDITNAQRARVLVHALPYIQDYSGKIVVVKYGGNAMVSEQLKDSVIRDICLLQLIGVKVVLVHGGGPEITEVLEKMGKQSAFVDGVRVTDEETVGVALMVLAGKINKTLVNLIELKGGSAIGLSGLDGHMLEAKIKKPELGYVGQITNVNVKPILDVIGSQGENMSALYRMAFSGHRQVEITASDRVIISASAIPGNEKSIGKIINELYRKGAEVIYDKLEGLHVSGHACQEELKIIHGLLKPRFFIPVHGEQRHLQAHSRLAQTMGMDPKNIFISDIGKVLELTKTTCKWGGTVPSGRILVDGTGVGDVGSVVLRDRKHLAQDGMLVVVVNISSEDGSVITGPDIITRGFVYVKESENLMEELRVIAAHAIDRCSQNGRSDWSVLKANIKNDLSGYLFKTTKRNPMILPVIMEI